MNPTHKALREATSAAHEEVDAAFAGFDLQDRESYARFLMAHAEVVWPLEDALDPVATRIAPDWAERRRGALLREDLAFLRDALPDRPPPESLALAPGSPPPVIPGSRVGEAPQWTDEGIAGTLYVLEGSRLGGRFLSRQLPPGFPKAYLNPDHRADRWPRLLDEIDARLDTPAKLQAALDAAHATFAAFARSASMWLAKG